MKLSRESVKQDTSKSGRETSRIAGSLAKGVILNKFIRATGHERKNSFKVLGGSRGLSRRVIPIVYPAIWKSV